MTISMSEMPERGEAPETSLELQHHCSLDQQRRKTLAPGKSVIYALVDPRNHAMRYVGKADNLTKRVTAHIHDRADTRKGRWIRSLSKIGLQPRVVILEEVEAAAWQQAERRWIARLRMDGCDLTNHTEGGEGLCNPSDETRSKLRQIRLAEWANPQRRALLLSIIQSPARNARVSAGLTGLRKSPEHIAKLPQMQRGRKLSAEHADKLRQLLQVKGYKWPKGQSPNAETRKKIAEALRGNRHTLGRRMPEAERLQRSITQRGRPKSAETREKIRLGALRRWQRHRKEVKNGPGIQQDSDSAYATE
jgi:hypothetical protein